MSSEAQENKAIVRRFEEEVARGNLDVIDELLSPDFVDRNLLPGQGPTREDFKRTNEEFLDAFSITSFTILEQIAEGDTVVTKYRQSGVSRGEIAGLPPTGEEDTVEGIHIHRISGGKITEEWSTLDVVPVWENLAQEIRERERVEQDLRVARSIQQASLPKEVPTLEGWQITPHYQPAREVGGDFYDFFELEYGRLGLIVGDATGKGVSAALVMSSARSMLRAVAQASTSPGDVLMKVNNPLVTDIPPNMFVTCFYAILDPKSGSLAYANAGHDLPYLRRRGGNCEELRASGMPLGLMPGMRYEEKEIIMEAGEAALFYSDGLVEAHDPKGKMFGFPRLRALVTEHGKERSLGDFLMEELYSFVGEGWEQEDDITLLTLKHSASPS
ncbi:MAG: SpoIIE family protein phosphatase [Actinomycetota bacterium]|nr:SpoIIE family protein phosphatase [Actinomycetota bacterium]